MKRLLLAALIALSATVVSANENTDIVLPGERWWGEFTAYVCADGNTKAAQNPAELEAFNVKFGRVTTDYSLDNILVKATFEENGVLCNYSVMNFADNAAWTIALVDSRAYSVNGTSDCAEGKALLDGIFEFNKYAYLHGRAAIFVPFSNSQAACGQDNIGIHFQVKGKLQ